LQTVHKRLQSVAKPQEAPFLQPSPFSFSPSSAVGFSPITDTVDSDGVGGFLEEDAVVADAKA
jgi:hypothetical protein